MKSYRKKIIAVIDATFGVVKRKPEKIQACTGFSVQRPAPSWLVSLIGRALHRYRRGQGFESRTSSFSGFLFTTAKVASITAIIFFHIKLIFSCFKYLIIEIMNI